MTYPAGLSRIVVGGYLFGPQGDDWATSLHLLDLQGRSTPPPINAVRDAFSAWFQRADARISQDASLRWVKANRIDGEGHYRDQTTNETTVGGTDGVAGGKAGSTFPQISVAVSLLTANSRGYGNRGRFYPPMSVVTLGSDGHISSGQTQEIATAASSLISSLQSDALQGWRVVVASKPGGVAVPVIRVAVGDVVDNQRRRRQSLVEKYYEMPTFSGGTQDGVTTPAGPGI
jgi:hypothetical protein